ncbi:plasmid replication protein RepC [Neorhizobium sp. NCHU2750]|uniref:plasmid replication protein RepC n=1 Tax=Neorhizobium sp. NCHU2750 TaxID=1825976 RepID=UPI000E7257EB|nr:replication initiation protein [Neorhizobium sp. NCHU2750]
MVERMATTPFGGARFSARNFALQTEVERRQESLRNGDAGNLKGKSEKWQLIRALIEARDVYGLSDRSIMVLEALTTFHQDRELDGSAPIIVFPSNVELSIRSRGMSPATLRRHLAALVEQGFIFRRDSANGKRFCRRDENGQVEDAFGFDLAPFALRAEEILASAEKVRAENKRLATLRAEMTLHLRDVAKIIEAALHEGRKGEWLDFQERLAALFVRRLRQMDGMDLERRLADLVRLRAEVETQYLDGLSEQEMSANDALFERHIQNSKTDPNIELSGQEQIKRQAPSAGAKRKPREEAISLDEFLQRCPQMGDYVKGGIHDWRDVLAAAELVRSMLGVSPSAWVDARQAMGDRTAAIVIAAMLEKAETIRSAGGYLRELSRKAQAGRFSVRPMLNALRV